MDANTAPQMPMGIVAAKTAAPLPPPTLSLPPSAGAPPSGPSLPMPPPGAIPPPPAGPAGAPMPALGLQLPPWKVKQQPDGSSVNYLPSPDGDTTKDIIIGVNQAPKLPKALQPKPAPTH